MDDKQDICLMMLGRREGCDARDSLLEVADNGRAVAAAASWRSLLQEGASSGAHLAVASNWPLDRRSPLRHKRNTGAKIRFGIFHCASMSKINRYARSSRTK